MREHGLDYLIATVHPRRRLSRSCSALLGVAKLMRFVPRSVMVGFVNALAILIFMAQVPHLIDVPWLVYPLVAVGLAIMVAAARGSPRSVPAPLVAIVVLTVVTVVAGDRRARPSATRASCPTACPSPGLPDVPFTLDTLHDHRARTRWPWRWSGCWSR